MAAIYCLRDVNQLGNSTTNTVLLAGGNPPYEEDFGAVIPRIFTWSRAPITSPKPVERI